jgi:hypothetical protein
MIWKTIGRWVLLAIAVPMAALGIRRLGRAIEAKHGQTRGASLLRKSADGLDWMSGRSSKHPARSR